jgi:hypothetical protein
VLRTHTYTEPHMNAHPHRTVGAKPATDTIAGSGRFYATRWHPPAGATSRHMRSIRGLALAAAIAFTLLAILVPLARAGFDEGTDGAPEVFDRAACYQLVQETGRMIAWARWELGAPESAVSVRFEDDTPEWIVDLTKRWIEDAYHWQVTDDQVRRWAGELGERSGSAHVDELTTPQTIAIWLRRIATQCHEQHT